ncbi:hypothetical protein SH668x_003646 [Planctomicrobium sp. SH668]|uniref:hypothetical protein n=1 Tax=Planctomicrobium sp. SH668 TaxID=3448126 RepID=UPI003F5C0564
MSVLDQMMKRFVGGLGGAIAGIYFSAASIVASNFLLSFLNSCGLFAACGLLFGFLGVVFPGRLSGFAFIASLFLDDTALDRTTRISFQLAAVAFVVGGLMLLFSLVFRTQAIGALGIAVSLPFVINVLTQPLSHDC